MVLWAGPTVAHADPCKSLGVGKDPGSSVSISTMVRHLAGLPPTPLTLELRGDGARLSVTAPAGSEVPGGDPGVFAFEGGTRASWTQDEKATNERMAHRRYVFRLDGAQLELLESEPLTYVALPLSGGKTLELNPDKDNQKAIQAGARCILSRTEP